MSFRGKVRKDKFYTEGMILGYGRDNSLDIIYKSKKYFLIKNKGSRDWSSRGQTSYYKTEYSIFRIESKKIDYFEFANIFSIYPGKQYRYWINVLKKIILIIQRASSEEVVNKFLKIFKKSLPKNILEFKYGDN